MKTEIFTAKSGQVLEVTQLSVAAMFKLFQEKNDQIQTEILIANSIRIDGVPIGLEGMDNLYLKMSELATITQLAQSLNGDDEVKKD